MEETGYLQLVRSKIMRGKLNSRDPPEAMRSSLTSVIVTDFKSYDTIQSQSSAHGLKDRRSAIEALAIREAMAATGMTVRWAHSQAQLADALTKHNWEASCLFPQLAVRGEWRLVHDEKITSALKRAMQGMAILDDTDEQVRDERLLEEGSLLAAERRNRRLSQV